MESRYVHVVACTFVELNLSIGIIVAEEGLFVSLNLYSPFGACIKGSSKLVVVEMHQPPWVLKKHSHVPLEKDF